MSRRVECDAEHEELRIRFPFDRDLVELVRGIPERRWHPAGKYWSVPDTHLESVARLLLPRGFLFSEDARQRLATAAGDLFEAAEASASAEGASIAAVSAPGSSFPEASRPAVGNGENEPTGVATEPTLTVSQLNDSVRAALGEAFPRPFWLQGEVIGYDRNAHKSHVYFQLAEKLEDEDRASAVVTVVLFQNTRMQLERRLAKAMDPLTLKDGLRIRILGRVDLYSPMGSYQVIVEDLDPEFTLGEISRNRERVLAEVDKLGLRERNAGLLFPVPTLRIGLVTSLGSDAYNDFLNEVEQSGYAFELTVRDCHVQGQFLERDVLSALDYFRHRHESFDVVAVVRGGGSRTDLMGFDSLSLALAVARHPLKVIVGIGHHRDRGVLDFIAHSEKTPTAVAKVLIELAARQEQLLLTSARRLSELAAVGIEDERSRLGRASLLMLRGLELRLERSFSWVRLAGEKTLASSRRVLEGRQRDLEWRYERIAAAAVRVAGGARQRLEQLYERLPRVSGNALHRCRERAEGRRSRVEAADPQKLLARGFAWLKKPDGSSLKRVADAGIGDEFVARLADGEIDARVMGLRPRESSAADAPEQ